MLPSQLVAHHVQLQLEVGHAPPEEMSLTGNFSTCNALTTGHAQDQVYKDQQTQGVNVLLGDQNCVWESKGHGGSRKGTIQKSRLPATQD